VIRTIANIYAVFARYCAYLQSPFLLAVRLYWGWQFAQAGWGKLQHLDRVAGFFHNLGIPLPGISAPFVAGVEFVGGILLILGLASRLTGLVLTLNMFVAYWTAERDALFSVFSNPGKFYGADPFTFLFAALLILVFGAGLLSVDALLAARLRASTSKA
jgi:putative oxidoreductase